MSRFDASVTLMGRALALCPPAPRAHWLTQRHKVPLRAPPPDCRSDSRRGARYQTRTTGGPAELSPSPASSRALRVSLFFSMKERRLAQPLAARCKLVLVGDVQCGKTAMLQVLVKDCYPEVSCCCSSATSGTKTECVIYPGQTGTNTSRVCR